ncbi:hypothetical protein BH11BAC1_BH11BAC1_09120 [soil metagenome]
MEIRDYLFDTIFGCPSAHLHICTFAHFLRLLICTFAHFFLLFHLQIFTSPHLQINSSSSNLHIPSSSNPLPKPSRHITLGLRVTWIGKDRWCGIIFYQFTEVKECCPVAHPSRLLHVMGDNNNRVFIL